MPRLLIFAPCERVILGQDNSASLIVIIQQMQFQMLPGNQPIPPGAGVFARFSIFSQFQRLPTDGDRIFEQRIALSLGNDPPVIEAITEFQMTERLHRLIASVPLLPIMNPGEYSFKLFVRERGEQNWGAPVADYPFEVVHTAQPAVAANL